MVLDALRNNSELGTSNKNVNKISYKTQYHCWLISIYISTVTPKRKKWKTLSEIVFYLEHHFSSVFILLVTQFVSMVLTRLVSIWLTVRSPSSHGYPLSRPEVPLQPRASAIPNSIDESISDDLSSSIDLPPGKLTCWPWKKRLVFYGN